MRRALGKGLSQLLGEQFESKVSEIPVAAITPNKRQPRRHFDQDALEELADSIRVHGVLAPILVRPLTEGKYELIAGERRWRATQLAGLKTIPAVVRAAAGQDSLELAIIENIQREDISAYESALAYKALMEEFGLNQEEVAMRVGKTRATISNTLRLLKLPTVILEGLQKGDLSEGHARALLALPSEAKQLEAYSAIKSDGLSVRDVENLGKTTPKTIPTRKGGKREEKDIYTRQLETAISEKLGSPSRIDRQNENGTIQISFYGDDDLQRILDSLGVEL
jgi:ParB family transcriptional regulator, chromosome partitioning protein